MAEAKSEKRYAPVVRVRLVREGRKKYGPSIRCASDMADACKDLLNEDREHFVCVHMDVKNRIVGMETVSVGHLSSALVHPREVFKGAILSNAASVCLAHNHPSGDPEPSREDIELTERLTRAGDLLGIPVLDHVIVSSSGFRSMKGR